MKLMAVGQQPEAAPVVWADAMIPESLAMLGCTIPLIPGPVVLRILGMDRFHKSIPAGLRQDGSSSDRKVLAVTLYDTPVWDLSVAVEKFPVNKQLIRNI